MTIISSVIAGVVLLLKILCDGKLSPIANYAICLVFLVSLIFPFAIYSRISIYNVIDISNVKNKIIEDKIINLFNENTKPSEFKDNICQNIFQIHKNNIKFTVCLIYFIIFVTKFLNSMFSYFKTYIKVGNHNFENEKINLILEESKKRLKIRKNIKIIKQDLIDTPSIIGIINPKILINDAFLELDEMSMLNIFIHELSHYKKKDNIVNFIMIILKDVYWFNPIVYIMFKDIRNNIEYATDEMAISKMNSEEKQSYCMLMLVVATTFGKNKSTVLGISNGAKNLKNRIKWIALEDNFKKNSKIIFFATSIIMILICLLFYPTSYGINDLPELYLKLEDGTLIEVSNTDTYEKINEIEANKDSKIGICIKGGKPDQYIFYTTTNLKEQQNEKATVYTSKNKMYLSEKGEYIYKFNLTYGNSKNAEYAIKINVE